MVPNFADGGILHTTEDGDSRQIYPMAFCSHRSRGRPGKYLFLRALFLHLREGKGVKEGALKALY